MPHPAATGVGAKEWIFNSIPILESLGRSPPATVSAARRPVERQRGLHRRRAGDLRPGGVLRRSRSRSRDDRAVRRISARILFFLSETLSPGCGIRAAETSLQPLPPAQPPEPLRLGLPRAGAADARPA